jgi:hypothetical protein
MSLKWEESLDGNPIYLETVLDGKSWEKISTQLVDVFKIVLHRIASLKPESWNRIYFEFWPDSGRIIIYPHKRGKSRSVRPLSVDVEIPFLQAEHDNLPNEEEDPNNFETHYGALICKLSLAIDNSLEKKDIKKLLSKLAENTDFTVWVQDADDTESLGQMTILLDDDTE